MYIYQKQKNNIIYYYTMKEILKITDTLLNNIFNNQDYTKVISLVCLIYIVYIAINKPSNNILLLFNNNYFIVLYLLFTFYISFYNPFISFLFALIFGIIIDKLYKFKLVIEKYNGGGRRNKDQYHMERDALSYFLT